MKYEKENFNHIFIMPDCFLLQHPVEAKIHPAQRPFRLKHSNKLKAFLRPRMNLLKLNHKQKA